MWREPEKEGKENQKANGKLRDNAIFGKLIENPMKKKMKKLWRLENNT